MNKFWILACYESFDPELTTEGLTIERHTTEGFPSINSGAEPVEGSYVGFPFYPERSAFKVNLP